MQFLTPVKRLFSSLLWLLLFTATLATATESAGQTDKAESLPARTQGEQPLVPLEVSYSASMDKGISINGSAVRTLTRQDDGTWLYRFDVDSFLADIRESVILRWKNNRVIPLTYRYELSGLFLKNRTSSIDFDWENGVATGEHRGDSFSLELRDHSLDPLGYQLQLHQDIKAGKKEMAYHVIDKGSYDEDRFAIIGKESISTSQGQVQTLKAEKVRSEDSKRETLMWFAPEQEYLLMRLVQVEPDGSRYEINIEDAEIRP